MTGRAGYQTGNGELYTESFIFRKSIAMKTIVTVFCFLLVVSASGQIRMEENKIISGGPLLFKPGTAELLPETEATLKTIAAFMEQKSFISLLRVEGHVVFGSAGQSQTLSEQRAVAVVKRLLKNGLDCKRLLAVGFGDTKPVAARDAPDKELNSRIVFVVASLRGRAIGGLPADGGGKPAGNPCE